MQQTYVENVVEPKDMYSLAVEKYWVSFIKKLVFIQKVKVNWQSKTEA